MTAIGFGSEASTRSSASMRSVGACSPGSSTTSPRAIASLLIPSPTRFSEHRWPAAPRSTGTFWACTARTRAPSPEGPTTTWSPAATLPETTVPVTTVPAPARVKARSTGRRRRPQRAARPGRALLPREERAKGWDALAGPGRHREDRGAVKAGGGEQRADLRFRGGSAGGVGKVGLGEGDGAARRSRAGRGSRGARRSAASGRRRRRRRAARSRCPRRRRAWCGSAARGRARRRSR